MKVLQDGVLVSDLGETHITYGVTLLCMNSKDFVNIKCSKCYYNKDKTLRRCRKYACSPHQRGDDNSTYFVKIEGRKSK